MVAGSIMLSLGTFAGVGTVNAVAEGCSVGYGPTWTSATCTTLNGGNAQRAYQWCKSSGVGWQYGLLKYTSSSTSATPDCYGGLGQRGQQIY